MRIVTLNRPETLNAADDALHGAAAEVWRILESDDDARAIVLTGACSTFCAGGDLGLLKGIMGEGAEIVRGMTSVRVPIVAAVNGPAVGLGCSLAAMSDLVV